MKTGKIIALELFVALTAGVFAQNVVLPSPASLRIDSNSDSISTASYHLPLIPYTLVYFPTVLVDTVGKPVLHPANPTTDPSVRYAVSPGLPSGVFLNATTGVISGTPTVTSSANSYSITATYTGGSSTALVSLSVISLAPTGFAYAVNPLILTMGKPMQADVPLITGNVTHYTVTPALPAGLLLDSVTGVVSGTAIDDTIGGYTVTATNPWGSTSLVLSILIPGSPEIISAPTSQTVQSHTMTVFSVHAEGTPNLLAYQWIRNGSEILKDDNGIKGTTTNTLIIMSPSMQDNGATYQCLVENDVGYALTAPAMLSIKGAITAIAGPFVVHQTGSTPFSFQLPEDQAVHMSVTNIQGHVVWSRDYAAQSDSRTVLWNGSGSSGDRVAPGMYVVQMQGMLK